MSDKKLYQEYMGKYSCAKRETKLLKSTILDLLEQKQMLLRKISFLSSELSKIKHEMYINESDHEVIKDHDQESESAIYNEFIDICKTLKLKALNDEGE